MQKFTFAFPDPISLWQFKSQVQAINVTITPKKNIISGLFPQQDVELALNTFKAIAISQAPSSIEKQKTTGNRHSWLRNYSTNYSYGTERLKKVVNSIYSFKLF